MKTKHEGCCSALLPCVPTWTRPDLKHCVMENSAVVWNAPLLSTCFWGNRRMISSEYNSDKCSEHDGQAVIYILFKEVQRGVIVISHVESMCAPGQTWSLHTHTTYLDLKWFGSGFMVSCYSIILLSAASVRAALGGVSWYRMCHCSPNPIFSSVFCCPCMIQPPGEITAYHPSLWLNCALSFLTSSTIPDSCTWLWFH